MGVVCAEANVGGMSSGIMGGWVGRATASG